MTFSSKVVLCMAAATVMTTAGCASLPSWTSKQLAVRDRAAAESLESQLSLARLSERHGQTEFATQVYDNVLEKNPGNQTAHHRLAVMAVRASQLSIAETHFQQALANGERSPDLLGDVGYFLYVQDRLEEAEAILLEALASDPQNGRAHTNLGLVLGEQGRFDESLRAFQQAMGEAEARANLAYVFTLHGDLPKAEAEFHHALALNNELKPAATALIQLNQHRRAANSAVLAQSGGQPDPQVQHVRYQQPSSDPLALVQPNGSEFPVAHAVRYETNGQQPGVQQPGVQQPGIQQPGIHQLSVQQPGVQQPGVHQLSVQQPGVQQPGVQQPGAAQPTASGTTGPAGTSQNSGIHLPAIPTMTIPAAFNSWQSNPYPAPAAGSSGG